VKTLAGARPAAVPRTTGEKPEFEADWKTRYEWDSGEYADLMALRQDIAKREAAEAAGKKSTTSKLPAARPAPKPAAKTAAPPPATKDEPVRPAAPASPATPTAPTKPAAAARPATSAAPAAPAEPAAPPAKPPAAPPAPVPAKAAPAAPTPAIPVPAARVVAKVRLTGPGVDLSVTAPGTYEIGRLSEVALRIVHPTVSRRQARLTLGADRLSVRIEHVGSSPTLVNGRVLHDSTALSDGDQLQLGEVSLSVKLE
jgi:hypothetical protein